MDLEASCEMMREYLCRRFGEKLEELKIGNSFVFKVQPPASPENNDPEAMILDRANEPITFSKDFTSFKTDKETMEGTMTVTIIPEEDVLESGQFEECPEFDVDDDLLVQQMSGADQAAVEDAEKEAEEKEREAQNI